MTEVAAPRIVHGGDGGAPRPAARRLRIWHVYLIGGLQRVDGILSTLALLADRTAHTGHAVTVWLLGDDPAALTDAVGDHAYDLEVRPSTADALAEMRRRLRCAPPDVTHLHSCMRPPHLAVAGLMRRAGVPFVISPHSALSAPTLLRYRWRKWAYGAAIERRLVGSAGGLACLTRVERDDALRYARRFDGRVGVIANPAPEELFSEPPWSPATSDPATIVTLARWDVHQKGLDVLAEIARRMPDVSFRVHGAQDHNQPRATEQLRRDAPPNFALLPPVYGAAKTGTLRAAAMFVQPSRWEGMSAALIEAMALGVPCAVSTYVARTLPVTSDGLGVVLDGDPARAAHQLRRALDDTAARSAWSTAARRHARSAFAPQRVVEQLLDLYHGTIADAARRATTST